MLLPRGSLEEIALSDKTTNHLIEYGHYCHIIGIVNFVQYMWSIFLSIMTTNDANYQRHFIEHKLLKRV